MKWVRRFPAEMLMNPSARFFGTDAPMDEPLLTPTGLHCGCRHTSQPIQDLEGSKGDTAGLADRLLIRILVAESRIAETRQEQRGVQHRLIGEVAVDVGCQIAPVAYIPRRHVQGQRLGRGIALLNRQPFHRVCHVIGLGRCRAILLLDRREAVD